MIKLTDEDIMPYGVKWRGQRMKDVPASYFHWMYRQIKDKTMRTLPPQEVIDYIEENKSVLKSETPDLIWD